MVYESHGKKMTIAGELGSNGFAAYLCNMKTWDDRTPVAASEREQIINNIKQAFAIALHRPDAHPDCQISWSSLL